MTIPVTSSGELGPKEIKFIFRINHSLNQDLLFVKKIKKTDYPSSALLMNSWPIYNRIIHMHETDKSGVIHFNNYFKIAEEALYSGLKRLGVSFENFEYAISVISIQANFYQPIKFAEHISVIITSIKIQQEQLIFNFDFNNSDHVCLAKIQLTFVLVETTNRKTVSIPKNLKDRLKQKVSAQDGKDSTSSIQIYT